MSVDLFQSVSIIFIFIATTAFLLLFFEVGYQIGKYYQSRHEDKVNTIQLPVVAALLAMLAFVLAFAFSIAASRYDLRKKNVIAEANIISKAYLSADLVDQPYRTEVKRLLREYVGIRLESIKKNKLKMVITRSLELHKLLWAQATSAAKLNPNRFNFMLTQSINEIIEMHEKRIVAGIRDQTPGSIWFTIYVIAAFAMLTLGSQAGLIKTRRLFQIIPTVLAFSALITLVAELDRPADKGQIKIGQEAMIELQNKMN
jgi:hypothetical protein